MRNDIQISKHKMFGLSVTPLSKLSNKILSVNFIVINNIVPFVYKKKTTNESIDERQFYLSLSKTGVSRSKVFTALALSWIWWYDDDGVSNRSTEGES